MVMKEINPTTWLCEKDCDKIKGFLVRKQKDVGPNGANLYTLEVDKEMVDVWGSTILDQRMALVNIGDFVEIEFKGLGEKKAGQNAPKIFKVSIDDEVTKKVEQHY